MITLGRGNREEQKGGITKEKVKTFGGNPYFHYLDYSDDFTGINTCQNISMCIS